MSVELTPSAPGHWSTRAHAKVGLCKTCRTVYRWSGAPKLGEARCIDDDTTLTQVGGARRTGDRVRDVDGEWLR